MSSRLPFVRYATMEMILALFLNFRYLVDTKWFKQLQKYLKMEPGDTSAASDGDPSSLHPGNIDNSPLFNKEAEEAGTIRDNLLDEMDFVLVPNEAWDVLLQEFGLTPGQDAIARKARTRIQSKNLDFDNCFVF